MRPIRGRLIAVMPLVVALAGCSRWSPLDVSPPVQPPARQQFRVWVDGHSHRMHGVWLDGDSIIGVPYLRPPTCVSCRVGFNLREVSRVETQGISQIRSAFFLAAVGGVILSAFMVAAGGP